MIKKTLYLQVAALFLFCSNAFAEGQKSIITITGNFVDNACIVSSQNINVNLMNQANKQFHVVGDHSVLVPFKIVLGPCGAAVQAVKFKFQGAVDSDNKNLLKIVSGNDAAAGLGVELLDAQQTMLPINADFEDIGWTALNPGVNNVITFYASMMATQVPITAGTVTSDASFMIEFQ